MVTNDWCMTSTCTMVNKNWVDLGFIKIDTMKVDSMRSKETHPKTYHINPGTLQVLDRLQMLLANIMKDVAR